MSINIQSRTEAISTLQWWCNSLQQSIAEDNEDLRSARMVNPPLAEFLTAKLISALDRNTRRLAVLRNAKDWSTQLLDPTQQAGIELLSSVRLVEKVRDTVQRILDSYNQAPPEACYPKPFIQWLERTTACFNRNNA